MNKKKLVTIAGALLMLSSMGSTVNASSQVALTHNSYVYDQNGHRIGNIVLKKNQKVKVTKTKKIKGKKYAKIGKNRFIRANNYQAVASFKPKAGQTSVVLAKNAYIYDEAGNTNKDKLLKGSSHQVYQVKWIKGNIYYMIGANQWIKGSNVGSLLGMPMYPENTKSESLNSGTTTNNSSNTSSPVIIVQNPTNNGASSNTGNSGKQDTTKDDEDDYENAHCRLAHIVPVYDVSGNHIPGAFGKIGDLIRTDLTKTINGKTYYKVEYTIFPGGNSSVIWSSDDSSDRMGYISKTSLSDDYKLPTPASRDELLALQSYIEIMNHKVNEHDSAYKLNYASKNSSLAFSNAYERAIAVSRNIYSTSEDIAKVKENLEDAINKLDGKEITVKMQEKLSQEKISEIEELANKMEGVTDAKLSGDIVDGNLNISFTRDGTLINSSVNRYVHIIYQN